MGRPVAAWNVAEMRSITRTSYKRSTWIPSPRDRAFGSLKCRGKPDRILQMQSYCYSEPPLTELASFDLLVDTPARLIVADEPDSRLPLGHLHNNGSKGEATPHTKLLIDPM